MIDLTPIRVLAARTLLNDEHATAGPWLASNPAQVIQVRHITRDVWVIPLTISDALFIAHARADAPALAKVVEALIPVLEKLNRCAEEYDDHDLIAVLSAYDKAKAALAALVIP